MTLDSRDVHRDVPTGGRNVCQAIAGLDEQQTRT